mmetsp:Transcript_11192/g.12817  ORF Transcript_11192/g.12817 Transcript_11192/m.12817 type:complete len:178 (-) Transcript_11192:164-697(-)
MDQQNDEGEEILDYLTRVGIIKDPFYAEYRKVIGKPQNPPPASANALEKQLQTIIVTPDIILKDETNNRFCCICLEPNRIGTQVKRLPCQHIFHPKCIRNWFVDTCTCPICRYALETDNAQYNKTSRHSTNLWKEKRDLERKKKERNCIKIIKNCSVVKNNSKSSDFQRRRQESKKK